jgi:hypothetical protein
MAAIDKIYGTQKQYDELFEWLNKNKPYAIRYMYMKDGWMPEDERPISNFTHKIDKWLMLNCPIAFVQKRLKEQYGDNYKG